jgi:predicted  nucleic acid-binding Zn-ribbon protein
MAKQDETKKQDLTSDLKKLSAISEWFEEQKEIDVEEGLKKVKEAATLIKVSRERLKAVENEFEEVKKEIDLKEGDGSEEGEKEVDAKNIPF